MAEKNDDRFLLKLPSALRARAQAQADKEDRSLSWIIRHSIENYLQVHCTGDVLISGDIRLTSAVIRDASGVIVDEVDRA